MHRLCIAFLVLLIARPATSDDRRTTQRLSDDVIDLTVERAAGGEITVRNFAGVLSTLEMGDRSYAFSSVPTADEDAAAVDVFTPGDNEVLVFRERLIIGRGEAARLDDLIVRFTGLRTLEPEAGGTDMVPWGQRLADQVVKLGVTMPNGDDMVLMSFAGEYATVSSPELGTISIAGLPAANDASATLRLIHENGTDGASPRVVAADLGQDISVGPLTVRLLGLSTPDRAEADG